MRAFDLRASIFCGVVRNGGDALSLTLKCMTSLRNLCDYSKAIIVTNDNSDKSDEVLHDWQKESLSNIVIRADGLIDAFANRIDRIAAARNLYLSRIQPFLRSGHWETVVVLDFDGPNINLDISWFEHTLPQLDIKWSALFANQRTAYYDLYALRHPVWCPHDCLIEVYNALPRGINRFPYLGARLRHKVVEKIIHARQYYIPPDHAPIPVCSAFGGLAIYKAELMVNSWYGSRIRDGRNTCEHVLFHSQVHRNASDFYIIPSLLNDAPPEHLGKASGRIFDKNCLERADA